MTVNDPTGKNVAPGYKKTQPEEEDLCVTKSRSGGSFD